MKLPAIYISLYLLTVIPCFFKGEWISSYKKTLIWIHISLLILLLTDIFAINFKGVLVDRIMVMAFLLTASATFALYKNTLKLRQKIYFGFFIFYPAITALTFLIDRLGFAIIASPLLATLTIPATRFSDNNYDIREQFGIIAPMRLQLIKKGFMTETVLGNTNDEDVVYLDITSIKIINQTNDTTTAVITTKEKSVQATFAK